MESSGELLMGSQEGYSWYLFIHKYPQNNIRVRA